MWRSPPWLCLWGLAIAVGVMAEDSYKTIPLRTHSLSSPYLDSEMQIRWWDFGGDTVVNAGGYIRLVPDRPSRAGWLFSRVPLTATNWQIEVEFDISGKGSNNLFGDGMAMWLTKQRGQQGSVFGAADNFEGLGVFLDTYKNGRGGVVFPYISTMMGDGKTSYDKLNDGKANELAGCSARGIRNNSMHPKLRLTYFQDKSLKLELMYKNVDEWTLCFDVPNVKIPNVAYLGFSAATGDLSDNHDIIQVDTKNMYTPNASGSGRSGTDSSGKAQYDFPLKGKGNGARSGWTWFFIKVVLFLLLIIVAYVGITAYRSSSRGSRF